MTDSTGGDDGRPDLSPPDPEGDQVLSPIVARAAESLRADLPVRAEWRAGLLAAVGAEAAPRRMRLVREVPSAPSAALVRRGWTLSPVQSVAAGLALFALGAASSGVVLHGRAGPGGAMPAGVAAAAGPAPAAAVTAVATALPAGAGAAAAGPGVRFMLVVPAAARVSIVGDFNRWDPRSTPMRRLEDGRTWVVDVPLEAGRHVYAFVVDGGLTVDPAAPRAAEDDFGVPSSVVLVPRTS